MINTTEQCNCGAEKRRNLQWCDECWEALQTKTQDRYIAAAEAMRISIVAGKQELSSGSAKNEQPRL